MKQHPVFDDITHALDHYKDRTAIIDKNGRSYSYAELKTYITGTRAELKYRGVGKGSKVLVFVPMSMELYAILEAIFSLGATAIFLDPWMKGKKMGQVIKQVQPDLFVVTKRIAKLTWLLPATWGLKKWSFSTLKRNDDEWEIEQVDDEDNALITFTSGTSGAPKGANRTFAFLLAQSESLKDHLQRNPDETSVDFTNFPIVGLADFALGNTVVIPRINLMKIHKANSDELIDHIHEVSVSRIIVSPSLLSKVLEGSKSKGQGSIAQIVTGGAPISKQLISDCLELFKNVELEGIYGSTEAEPISISSFQSIYDGMDDPRAGVYVGRPVKETRVKILEALDGPMDTEYFHSNQLGSSQVGEVLVTGDHVNKKYYKNHDAFKKAKVIDEDGEIWHRTGDIGYFNDEQLFLVGRDHRIMTKDGSNYYPYPVEQMLMSEFELSDVGYVQSKDGRFVVHIGRDNVDSSKVRQHLEDFEIPVDEVKIHSKALPRDARHRSKLQIEDLI